MELKIKNRNDLDVSELRHDALAIIEAGLQSIDTKKLVRDSVSFKEGILCVGNKTCSVEEVERLFFVGVGKCAHEAAEVIEEKLGFILAGGIALDVHAQRVCKTEKIKCIAGTHPEPSITNVEVSKEIVALLDGLTERDAVIVVVSGGGSTLLCLPEGGAEKCVEERLILETLYRKGVPIRDINTVRKHMSEVRGGFLAKHAYPAQVFGLIFSDVPGDDVSTVASGPTIRDTTTVADAEAILAKYEVLRVCGIASCGLIETPKEEKYFERVSNTLVVSNNVALTAMLHVAKERGYNAEIVNGTIEGEAHIVGSDIAKRIRGSSAPTAHIYGGETVVKMEGTGRGGRNQEVALSAVPHVDEHTLVVSIASDGYDNGTFAGGIADGSTVRKAKKLGFDIAGFLANHNSRGFFEQTGDYIFTEYTGSNVADLLLALKK